MSLSIVKYHSANSADVLLEVGQLRTIFTLETTLPVKGQDFAHLKREDVDEFSLFTFGDVKAICVTQQLQDSIDAIKQRLEVIDAALSKKTVKASRLVGLVNKAGSYFTMAEEDYDSMMKDIAAGKQSKTDTYALICKDGDKFCRAVIDLNYVSLPLDQTPIYDQPQVSVGYRSYPSVVVDKMKEMAKLCKEKDAKFSVDVAGYRVSCSRKYNLVTVCNKGYRMNHSIETILAL